MLKRIIGHAKGWRHANPAASFGNIGKHCAMLEMMAGYGESVITPPAGVELCGYGFYLVRRAESVLDDLKARAVCVSGGGTTLFLIVCDLLGFDVATSDGIRRAIAAQQHVPAANVLLACTHTHSGPASQFLRGCGELAPDYTRGLLELIMEAARRAAADRRPCEISTGLEQAEPIGYNRRLNSFHPIDPTVAAVIFQRENFPICLAAYACHAVTRGVHAGVSADWPGAAASAMEREGYRCAWFQGFCGDIDPVCCLNRRETEAAEDLAVYSRILKHHVSAIARKGKAGNVSPLAAIEKRISLPLEVPPDKKALDNEYAMIRSNKNEARARFADEWHEAADAAFARFHASPRLDNIPVQGMRLGGMNLLALPAEVFCEYGLALRARGAPLLTIGYANGNTGYWPVKAAYEERGDYAAFTAPKLYGVFPFHCSLEDTILAACRELLAEIQAGKPE